MDDLDSGSINLENSEEFRRFLETSLTDNSMLYNSLIERTNEPDLDIPPQPVSPILLSQLYSLSPSPEILGSQREDMTHHFENASNFSNRSLSGTLSLNAQVIQVSASALSVSSNIPHSETKLGNSKNGANSFSQTRDSYKPKLSIPECGDFTDTFSKLDTEDVGERTIHSPSLSHSHFGLETLKEIENQRSQNDSKDGCSETRIINSPIYKKNENLPFSNNSVCLSSNIFHNEPDGKVCYSNDSFSNNSFVEEDETRCVQNLNTCIKVKECKSKQIETITENTVKLKKIMFSDQSDEEKTISLSDQSPPHLDAHAENIDAENINDSTILEFTSDGDHNDQINEKQFPDNAIANVTSLSEKVQALANKELRTATKLVIQKKKEKISRIPRLANTFSQKILPRIGTIIEPMMTIEESPVLSQNPSLRNDNVRSNQIGKTTETQILQTLNSKLEDDLKKEKIELFRLTSELQLINDKFIEKDSELNRVKYHTQNLEKDLGRVQIQLFSANSRIEKLIDLNHFSESVGECEEGLKIQRTLNEQDELIQSYQKENEKIYEELRRIKEDKKSIEIHFLNENQTLTKKIYNLKIQLGVSPENAQSALRGPISADEFGEVGYLEMIIEKGRTERKELERKRIICMQQISEQEIEINDLKQMLRDNSAQTIQIQEEKFQLAKSKHEDETIVLRKKLKWFTDNQKLIEKELSKVCKLQARNSELEREFELIKSLDKNGYMINNVQLVRMQELEKQNSLFRDLLSEILPHSNSLIPELDIKYTSTTDNLIKNELELELLDNALVDKENACEIQINSLKLNMQNLEKRYDEKLKSQHCKISALQRKQQLTSHPHATAQSLLREVESIRQGSVAREQELIAQVDQLAQDNKQLKALIGTYKQRAFTYRGSSVPEVCGEKLTLSDYSKSLMEEIVQLRKRLKDFQKERNVNTNTELEFNYEKLNNEMQHLKNEYTLINEQLESEKSRHFMELSSAKESHILELEKEHREHTHNLNALKMYHAVQYSGSQGAQLASDNTSLKLKISWLEDRMVEYRKKISQYEQLSSNEDKLNQKIQLLSNELVESKQHQRPEMRHFFFLKESVAKLENRLSEQENMVNSGRNSIIKQGEHYKREDELRSMLSQKAMEIDNFKNELDSLLILMKQVQRQNLIDVPNSSISFRKC